MGLILAYPLFGAANRDVIKLMEENGWRIVRAKVTTRRPSER